MNASPGRLHNNSPHIITYTDSAGMGGAEISLGNLIAAVSSDWQITVAGVAPKIVEAIAGYRNNTRQIVLPPTGAATFTKHWLTLRQLHPQIIHFNCCTPWANAVGLMAAMLLPNVKIARVDQLPLRTTDALTLWRTHALCLRVDAHVAVGQTSARRMEDFYALGRNSVWSIPNGVPEISASAPALSNQPLVVGSIGRLDAMKAHDILLRAVAQVENVEAVILGEGEQRLALEQLAQKLKINNRVQLKGWVANPRDYLAQFDVVALPSRSEGFPLVMVEAMLAARPVIATRVGSMPEAIIDGQTGYLIEKDDVAGLAHALRELRDQPARRIRMGQAAKTLAQANWTAPVMAAQYEQLWRQILALPSRSRLSVPRPPD